MPNDSELTPYRTPPVGQLSSIAQVRRELRKIYVDMRRGHLAPSDGTKLAFVLGMIARLIESGELEQRIEALERHYETITSSSRSH